jgi:hypothetical protein
VRQTERATALGVTAAAPSSPRVSSTHSFTHALVIGIDIVKDLLAPTSALPRATASFHPGDQP